MNARDAIEKAIDILGGPSNAARRLGVNRYQAVQQWVKAGRVPAKYCPLIERETQREVACEDLLPEVDWAYLRGTGTHRGA